MSEKPKVSRIQIKGVQYFKDDENSLYDTKTRELVGVWNPETKTIEPFSDDEEEEKPKVKPKTKVTRIQIKGVEYYRDAENNLYDPKTKEFIGIWTKKNEPLSDDEEDENDIQFEGSEFETKRGIWSFTIVISNKETEENPIEEDDEGNITQWEYLFPIFWNGVIESKTERTNIIELIPDFPKDYRIGTFALYTKNILNDNEKISKIDRKWGSSDSNISWTLDIEGNIQRLINEGELEGKKDSEEIISNKLRREEALKRMEETRLSRKAEREEKEKINSPEFIESKILELQEALKTETLPDKLKLLNKLLKGLEKRFDIATKEKLDREEYQLKTFGSKEEQEQKRQKEKEDLVALKKQLRNEKAKATREKNKKEKEEKEARLVKIRNDKVFTGLKEIGDNAKKLIGDIEYEKRMIENTLTDNKYFYRNDGLEILENVYDKVINERLPAYDIAVSKVPNYPIAEVQAYKDEVSKKLLDVKNKLIYYLLKSLQKYKKEGNETKSKELSKFIRSRFSIDEQKEALKVKKEKDNEEEIYKTWKSLISDIEARNHLDYKRGEKDEFANPIGKYAKVNYFQPDRDRDGYVINFEKFKKEQKKRIFDYNNSPEGIKEKQEVADYIASLEDKRQQALRMEEQYDFLPKQAATTKIFYYDKYKYSIGRYNPEEWETKEGGGAPMSVEVVDYKIDPEAKKVAKKLGVKIEPSKKKFKKIDVFDFNNQYITSVGDTRYNDYRSYIKEKGKEYADTRRRLYKIRHQKNRLIEGTPSYYADQLLW